MTEQQITERVWEAVRNAGEYVGATEDYYDPDVVATGWEGKDYSQEEANEATKAEILRLITLAWAANDSAYAAAVSGNEAEAQRHCYRAYDIARGAGSVAGREHPPAPSFARPA